MKDPNCTLCIEWEICPFHKPEPKQELKLTKYAVDAEADTVKIKVSQPTVIHGTRSKVRPLNGRVVSSCGEYIHTYQDGKLVDEEPND